MELSVCNLASLHILLQQVFAVLPHIYDVL